jgi:tetratricopeptide (TPR) repeat protein
MTSYGYGMLGVDPAEAEKCFEKALSVAAGAHGKDHPSLACILVLASRSALEQEEPERALRYLTTAARILEEAFGPTHLKLAKVIRSMGDANLELGELGAAEGAYRRLGEIYAAHCPPDDWRHAFVAARLGKLARKEKHYARAADFYEQALAIAERTLGANDKRLHDLLFDASEAHKAAGALPRAIVLAERLATVNPALLHAWSHLASVYDAAQDPRAAPTYRRYMTLLKATMEKETAEPMAPLQEEDETGRKS